MNTLHTAARMAVETIADAARIKALREDELRALESDDGLTVDQVIDGVVIPVAVWLVDGEARGFTSCKLCDCEVWETAKIKRSTFVLVDGSTDEILRTATAWETSMSLMRSSMLGGPGLFKLYGTGTVYVREIVR